MSVLLVIVAVLGASPALALNDLDGVYEGKFDCKGTTDFETLESAVVAALYVDEGPNNIVYVRFPNAQLWFRTTIVSAPDEDARGRLGGPDCDVSPTDGGHFPQAEVKAPSGSDKASLKGEFVTLNVGASDHLVQVCRFNLKRTGPLMDPITSCPPQAKPARFTSTDSVKASGARRPPLRRPRASRRRPALLRVGQIVVPEPAHAGNTASSPRTRRSRSRDS